MALNGLKCADVPLSNYSLTHSLPLLLVTSKWMFSVLITLHSAICARQKACVHRFSEVALQKDTYYEVLLGILCWESRSRPSMLPTHLQKKSLVILVSHNKYFVTSSLEEIVQDCWRMHNMLTACIPKQLMSNFFKCLHLPLSIVVRYYINVFLVIFQCVLFLYCCQW